jgi:threonine dehydrogenase-like Zn-dependent dehydrogenase
MRALVQTASGLRLERDLPPPAKATGEALIRVTRAGICNTDVEIVRGYLNFRGILGHEFVGVVEEVYGEAARAHAAHLIGQRVVGEINAACHRADCPACSAGMPTHCPNRTTLGIVDRDGAFADEVTLPVENLRAVPDEVTDDEAVFVEPLAANFEIAEQLHLRPTDRVLILGDGKMGQLAAQVLALSGCAVTVVGKHADKLALAARSGARTLLLEAATDLVADAAQRVDLVVECTGSNSGLALALRLVRPRGTVILKSTVADKSTLDLAPIVIDEIRVQGSRCGPFEPALRALRNKRLDVTPLISASYPLDDGLTAFDHAQRPGALKVLLRM